MPTPTLNGQVLGEAERATRAVLDRLLTPRGLTFHHWVVLNIAGAGPVERDQLVARMTHMLKIDRPTALEAITELTSRGLVEAVPSGEEPAVVTLTDAGQARHGEARTAANEITTRLYGDLPADDLATAGRVLTVITARANAELDQI